MRIKKTCNGCRALEDNKCSLNYLTGIETIHSKGLIIDRRPLEPCPKPTTIKKLITLKPLN